jgi:tRNA threonylcarbamoyladenosine biosynthesis protein TsaE
MVEQEPTNQSPYTWLSTSPQATHQLGVRLGSFLQPGVVIALYGGLGAGKTAFTQGIAAGLGVTEPVTSPTFTLVNRYRTAAGGEMVHIDCYRLGEAAAVSILEAAAIGLEEILGDPDLIIVIEWAERVAALLPQDHLQISLTPVEGKMQIRQYTLLAHGPQSRKILRALIESSSAMADSPVSL